MQVQVYSDHNINGHEALADQVRGLVEDALSKVRDRVTRVEVHLSDQNSNHKDGNDDMHCMIEAHLAGQQPLAVNHHATTLQQSVDGATEKLNHLIDHKLGRLEHEESHRTDPPLSRL